MPQNRDVLPDELPFGPLIGPDGNPVLADPTDVPEPAVSLGEAMDTMIPVKENQ